MVSNEDSQCDNSTIRTGSSTGRRGVTIVGALLTITGLRTISDLFVCVGGRNARSDGRIYETFREETG